MGRKRTASTTSSPRTISSNNNHKRREHDYVNLDIWHGLLPDEDTAALLKDDGDFLMRGIEKNIGRGYNITVSVRSGKEVLNAPITEHPSGVEFQGTAFATIKDVLDFYQTRKQPLILNGLTVILKRPIQRRQWVLRHKLITLGEELGAGSYGTVYKGTLQFENLKPIQVAIKVLSEMTAEASIALWKEARSHQILHHPNVVKMYGITNDYLPYYLVMELVSGGSVDSYLKRKGEKLGVRARVQILVEAACGLEYVHSKHLLHRDIAARNLLIDKVVKVADFGMSRKAESYKVDTTKPMNLRWLAPEVFKTSSVNKATDVYAFGVTMYECFTIPYTIPYREWKAKMVYDRVVVQGYRLEAPKLMPALISEVMADCLGPEQKRPRFKAILGRLRSYLTIDIESTVEAQSPQPPVATSPAKRSDITAVSPMSRSRQSAVSSAGSALTAVSPAAKSTESNISATSPAKKNSVYFIDYAQHNRTN